MQTPTYGLPLLWVPPLSESLLCSRDFSLSDSQDYNSIDEIFSLESNREFNSDAEIFSLGDQKFAGTADVTIPIRK